MIRRILTILSGTAWMLILAVPVAAGSDTAVIPFETGEKMTIRITAEGPAPLPDRTEMEVEGYGAFEIRITEPGEYHYHLRKTEPEQSPMISAESGYDVTVFAVYESGEMIYTLTAAAEGAGGKPLSLRFDKAPPVITETPVPTREPEKPEVTKEESREPEKTKAPGKTGPVQTGDRENIMAWAAAGGAAAAVLAAAVLRRRKRKDR